jgi:hypothetical protein
MLTSVEILRGNSYNHCNTDDDNGHDSDHYGYSRLVVNTSEERFGRFKIWNVACPLAGIIWQKRKRVLHKLAIINSSIMEELPCGRKDAANLRGRETAD